MPLYKSWIELATLGSSYSKVTLHWIWSLNGFLNVIIEVWSLFSPTVIYLVSNLVGGRPFPKHIYFQPPAPSDLNSKSAAYNVSRAEGVYVR